MLVGSEWGQIRQLTLYRLDGHDGNENIVSRLKEQTGAT